MAGFDIPSVGELNTFEDVKNYLYRQERMMKYLIGGNLGTPNIREVGGWELSEFMLTSQSGNVGFNSEQTALTDIRIWAGSSLIETAPFRVLEDGSFFSSNANITGSIHLSAGSSIDWGQVTKPVYTAADVGALATDAPQLTWIGPTGIYTGTLNANQINVGFLTGFDIRTGGGNQHLEMNQNGFASVDANLVKRISIQFTDNVWSNQYLVFRDAGGLWQGNISSAATGALFIEANGLNLSADRIELLAPTVDFNNATVLGFNATATFG